MGQPEAEPGARNGLRNQKRSSGVRRLGVPRVACM